MFDIFTPDNWAIFWAVLWRSWLITEALKRLIRLINWEDKQHTHSITVAFIAWASAFLIAVRKDADLWFAFEISIYVPVLHTFCIDISATYIQRHFGINIKDIIEGKTYKLKMNKEKEDPND